MATPTNLYDYYTQKGQTLPSLQQRSQLYQQQGLGQSYQGTAEQNTALLGKLMGAQATAPTTSLPSNGISLQNNTGGVPLTGNIGINSYSMGTTAKSPTDNISLATTTLPINQQKTQTQSQTQSGPNLTGTGGTPTDYSLPISSVAPVAPNPNLNSVNPNTANAAPYSGYIGALGNTAATQSPEYQAAVADYNQQKIALQNLQDSFATQNANVYGGGMNLGTAQGEQGILQTLLAQKSTPITQRMQADTQVMGAATAQQSAQQTGLGAAAAGTAPQPANILGTFNPATGQYNQYGGASGGGIGTGAQVTGNYASAQNYYQNMLPAYNSAANDLQAFQGWLNTPPSQGGGQGINFSQLNIGNKLQSWLLGQNFSDPRFPQLNTFLNDFTSKLSSLVGANSGQITNYKQQLVNSMLDPTATPNSILAQANTLMDVAQQSLKGVYNTFSAPIGSGNPNTLSTSNSTGNQTSNQSGTISAGGYNFNYVNGKYVAVP